MKNYEETFNLAKKLHTSGKIFESQKLYLEISKIYNNNYELFFLLGTTFLQQKNYNKAIENFDISIKLNSSFPNSFNNKGIALSKIQKDYEAISNYDEAIKLKKDYFDAYLNKAISLNKTKKYVEAIKYFKILIKIDRFNAKVFNNFGNVYKNLKNYNEAIKYYDESIKLDKHFLEAISNKSQALHSLKRYDESLDLLNEIFKINPNFESLLGNIISNKMHMCEWSNFNKIRDLIKDKILKKKIIIAPLFIPYLFDEPEISKINAEKFISEEFKYTEKFSKKFHNKKNNKIRIAYFSGDFSNHPVLHIMCNIFKYHDKSNFEIYAFSHGPNIKDNFWRDSIKNYFKKFYDISEMTDEEVFLLSQKNNIDIAVDLTGITKNARTEIFFKKIAPIQINYLGYPGTMGLDTIDYIIADKTIIPEDEQKYYFEKVIYLPNCYIPSSNDIKLKKSKKNFSRSEFNLPEKEIVFCAFHNPLKINPTLFDAWLNILKRVDNSVLWISPNNQFIEKNLKLEAERNSINPKRIIIAKRMEDINDHIERLKLADIFLDSYPYNSHSTTYDYIRAGLPMIIWKGNAYPSRVAASIYGSINLNEVIAKNKEEYENIAVSFANDRTKLAKLKKKIIDNSKELDLFNNKKFTKDLENIYKEIINN